MREPASFFAPVLLGLSTPNVDSPFSKALFIRTGDFHWFQEPEYQSGDHITPIPRRLLERALGEAGFEGLRIECAARHAVSSLQWWRMRALTWAIRFLADPAALGGQTLIAEAVRPARTPNALDSIWNNASPKFSATSNEEP